jgi:Flp pilus assembly protein TadG
VSGRRGQRGAAIVEFAVVLPIMLMLVFGIIDFGVVLHNRGLVGNGAREGARVGAVNPSVAAITTAARNASNISPATDVTVTATCAKPGGGACTFNNTNGTDEIDAGDTVVVNVRYTYNFITPIATMFRPSMVVESTARMRFEGT